MHREKTFLEFKDRVFAIPGGMLNAGSSEVSFQFQLPTGIPSSFYFKDKSCNDKPKAKVKYTVQATLCATMSNDEMKYKQVLIIREPPVAFKQGDRQSETSQITTCCCFNKGTSTMSSIFEKNIFLPNELIKGFVEVDNSHCTINCQRVEFAVEQRFSMNIANKTVFGEGVHHSYGRKNHLVEQNLPGPNAGEGDWKREMFCDLSKIHYEVATMQKDKKKGGKKNISPEDRFMMASIPPAVHGKWIHNEYHLIVKCTYDGCTCCSNLPDSDMQLSIVPMVNPECFGFKPPGGWQPYNLGGFSVNLAHHKD